MARSSPGADGNHLNCTCLSRATAVRQNLGAAALADRGEDGLFGTWARMRAGTPAATPPVARAGPPVPRAGPPVRATARHVPASARSHDPRRRRRVSLENLDSSMVRPS